MAQRKTLTVKQVEILRWIGEGCPDDGADDIGRRVSAAALRNRCLVTTSGTGPTWSAAITAKGKEYLSAVDGEDPPAPRSPASVTEQLIEDIVAAGGTLLVPIKGRRDVGVVDYEQRALAAIRHGKVPDGKRLVVRSAERGHLELALVEGPEEAAAIASVQVPMRVKRYHAAARTVRDDFKRLGVVVRTPG